MKNFYLKISKMYKVILCNKDSEILIDIKEFFNSYTNENCSFITIYQNSEDENSENIHMDNHMGRYEVLDVENKINGRVKIGNKNREILDRIIDHSKQLAINNLDNIEFITEKCLSIDLHSVTAPNNHPFAKDIHKDSDEYGIKSCSVLYYFDIDENVKDGELQIFDDEENLIEEIDVNPQENNVKIVLLNDGVLHCVNKINGSGKRNVLCIFLGIE